MNRQHVLLRSAIVLGDVESVALVRVLGLVQDLLSHLERDTTIADDLEIASCKPVVRILVDCQGLFAGSNREGFVETADWLDSWVEREKNNREAFEANLDKGEKQTHRDQTCCSFLPKSERISTAG